MKFWMKTLYLLFIYGLLAIILATTIFTTFKNVFSLDFVTNSLLTCVGSVFVLYMMFYIIVYKKKWYSIANKYIESVDLLQNILFFIFFPYFGIVLSQVEASPAVTLFRQIVGATLLTLKITMLIIKYTLKHQPLEDLDD